MIRRIGNYSKIINRKFYNETSITKISKPWKLIIKDVKSFFIKLNKNIIIFIRGSVPIGKAKYNISDIDFIFILNRKLSRLELAKIKVFKIKLLKEYDYIRNIDLSFILKKELNNNYLLNVYINAFSLILHGNYLKKIKKITYNEIFIEKMLQIYKTQITKSLQLYNSSDFKKWYIWIYKKIIRINFLQISLKTGCYTRDLFIQTEVYIEFYPHKKEFAKKLLKESIYPSYDKSNLIHLFNHLIEIQCINNIKIINKNLIDYQIKFLKIEEFIMEDKALEEKLNKMFGQWYEADQ